MSDAVMSPTIRKRTWIGLFLVGLALLLPGRAAMPPLDRDESRYLQATTQMLETHNWVDVRFQDQPRYLQPAGIYWLEAASVKLFSHVGTKQTWPFRIPSLIGAMTALLLTAWIAGQLFGAEAGWMAGLLLGCSVLVGWESRNATIDATQLGVILVAQTMLLRVLQDRERGNATPVWQAAAYWIALGCGLMLKGPVILIAAWGTLLGLGIAERKIGWWKRLRPAWGIPLMLAIVLPWCIGIAVVSGGSFFSHSVGHNLLGKVASGQESHGFPPGYHLMLFPLGFWPGSLFAVLAVPFVWARRQDWRVRFLLAWMIPFWVVFELIATKLPHYIMPTYPAIACLAAAALMDARPVNRWFRGCVSVVWAVLSLALAAIGPGLVWAVERQVWIAPVVVGIVIAVLALGGLAALHQNNKRWAVLLAAGAGLVFAAQAYELVLPRLTPIWLAPRLARAVDQVKICPDAVVDSASFSEPSLVFMLGEKIRLRPAAQAAADLAMNPTCNLALVDARDKPAFFAALAGQKPMPRAVIDGINYSTGKHLSITLYSGPLSGPVKTGPINP